MGAAPTQVMTACARRPDHTDLSIVRDTVTSSEISQFSHEIPNVLRVEMPLLQNLILWEQLRARYKLPRPESPRSRDHMTARESPPFHHA